MTAGPTSEEAKFVGSVWKANDERNKLAAEKERKAMLKFKLMWFGCWLALGVCVGLGVKSIRDGIYEKENHGVACDIVGGVYVKPNKCLIGSEIETWTKEILEKNSK